MTDHMTGLIWVQDANCFGDRTWAQAIAAVATVFGSLVAGLCGLTDGSEAGDWRLANVRELLSLVDYGYAGPAVPNAAGTGQASAADPFTNLGGRYWASTHLGDGSAWTVGLSDGSAVPFSDGDPWRVLAVRGGQ